MNAKASKFVISDYGYGRGPADIESQIYSLVMDIPKAPILLSHWDKDHYGLGTSQAAKEFKPSLTNQPPWNRTWVAPDLIRGVHASSLATQIQRSGKLVRWPNSLKTPMRYGNFGILPSSVSGALINNKNNSGALSLTFGDDESRAFYPGDANFEFIVGLDADDIKDSIQVMIATHHGSRRSIMYKFNPTQIGSSIPEAGSNGVVTFFDHADVTSILCCSCGEGNPYGHNKQAVEYYYSQKGYKDAVGTNELGTKDICFQFALDESAQLDKPQTRTAIQKAAAIKPSRVVTGSTSTWEALKGSLKPDPDPTKTDGPTSPSKPAFPDTLVIDGAKDGLAPYAIKNSYGQVTQYQVIAGELTIQNAPLTVKCPEDFAVPVLIQCQHIEVQSDSGVMVCFDVGNGDTWPGPANAGETGAAGDAARTGGYLDIRVVGNWKIKSQGNVVFDSETPSTSRSTALQVQYINGKGGDGQQGGRGKVGQDGQNGTNDSDGGRTRGKPAQPGAYGGSGAKGGNGGSPTSFPASYVTGTKSKMSVVDSKGTMQSLSIGLKLDNFGAGGKAGAGTSLIHLFEVQN